MPEPLSVELEQDLKDKPEPKVEPKAKEEKPKEEPKYVDIVELKKLTQQLNGISSTLRTKEKSEKELSKKLDDLENRLSGRAIKPSEAQDELDKLLEQGEWRKPVATVAEETVNRILKQREAEQANFTQQAQRQQKYENSVKTVYDRYPELHDQESDITKKWMKIVNEHPEWHGEPLGPIAAMHALEEELDKDGENIATNEQRRRARVNATSVRPGTPSKTQTITLSKEQKEFCKSSGISEEKYLQTLKTMSNHSSEVE